MVNWPNKWFSPKFATWNCFSLSKERVDFCKELQYDVSVMTELHNLQNKVATSKQWTPSALSERYAKGPKEGQYKDPAAGVAIMLSPKMAQHFQDAGHVVTRIVWVRFKGPTCYVFSGGVMSLRIRNSCVPEKTLQFALFQSGPRVFFL